MEFSREYFDGRECYVMGDAGALGARIGVSGPDFPYREFSSAGDDLAWDLALAAIREHQDREQFWPAAFYVNDHGNVSFVNIHSGDLLEPEECADLTGAGLEAV